MRTDLLVNNFVYRALNEKSLVIYNPNHIRTYLHVNDAVSAYLMVIKHFPKICGQILNVGSNRLNFSKLDLAKKNTEISSVRNISKTAIRC